MIQPFSPSSSFFPRFISSYPVHALQLAPEQLEAGSVIYVEPGISTSPVVCGGLWNDPTGRISLLMLDDTCAFRVLSYAVWAEHFLLQSDCFFFFFEITVCYVFFFFFSSSFSKLVPNADWHFFFCSKFLWKFQQKYLYIYIIYVSCTNGQCGLFAFVGIVFESTEETDNFFWTVFLFFYFLQIHRGLNWLISNFWTQLRGRVTLRAFHSLWGSVFLPWIHWRTI